jgi:hypothetical protein
LAQYEDNFLVSVSGSFFGSESESQSNRFVSEALFLGTAGSSRKKGFVYTATTFYHFLHFAIPDVNNFALPILVVSIAAEYEQSRRL